MSCRPIVIAVLAVLAALSTSCSSRETGGTRVGTESHSGGGNREDRAPDFTVTTFTGDSFALGEQKGTPVVLNFWESW